MSVYKHPTDPTIEQVISHSQVVRWWPGNGLPKEERLFPDADSAAYKELLSSLMKRGLRYETFTTAHIQNRRRRT